LRDRRAGDHNRGVHGLAVRRHRIAPSAATLPAVAALFVDEYSRDTPMVAIPRPEIQLVVRFGPSAPTGLDVHAFGIHARARRKIIRAGQRSITVRLRVGAPEAVLGVSASALAGRIVALDELWGRAETRQLLEQLAAARTTPEAGVIVESALAERLAGARGATGTRTDLALRATELLARANVSAVADELGVSERHLRRVFRDSVGMSPKAFAKLARFHRALRRASEHRHASWASIAAAAGYYDQAHLIDEFRAIAGVTPRALLGELGGPEIR
jgi:AraC-like DNA-binding protein